MKTFEQFVNEKWDDKNHVFGMKLSNKKEITGIVIDLVNFAEKYPIKEYSVDELYKLGGWHNYKDITVKNKSTNKYVKLNDISKEEKEKEIEKINKEVMKSNLKYPIIVSEKDNKATNILDGNHRVEKAHILKHDKIKGYSIPEEDLLKKFKNT